MLRRSSESTSVLGPDHDLGIPDIDFIASLAGGDCS